MQVVASISNTIGPDGEVDGFVTLNRDMTEYVAMQANLLAAEKERMALEQQREMLALREEFIATVSHDFRTPLTVISSSISYSARIL